MWNKWNKIRVIFPSILYHLTVDKRNILKHFLLKIIGYTICKQFCDFQMNIIEKSNTRKVFNTQTYHVRIHVTSLYVIHVNVFDT